MSISWRGSIKVRVRVRVRVKVRIKVRVRVRVRVRDYGMEVKFDIMLRCVLRVHNQHQK